ncbi:MAG: hypothetical protein JEZ14_22630 [Marinilabiliaceae bacterium]|nr:hypothetical protein [Marinilabiliaceae bacterium]
MNYIHHQLAAFEKMDKIPELKPHHISLYIALFRLWNWAQFENPIIIHRQEVMKMARIKSPTTFSNAMKYLNHHDFVKYKPSTDPDVNSKVYLSILWTSTRPQLVHKMDTNIKHTNNTLSIGESSFYDNQKATIMDTDERKIAMKSLNNNPDPQQDLFDFEETPLPEEKTRKRKKQKKNFSPSRGDARRAEGNDYTPSTLAPMGEMPRAKGSIPPPLEHIQIYFQAKNHSKTEAERFFNHYTSNGWLVSGKSPMKDWKASARNWMLNIDKFANNSSGSSQSQNADAERSRSNKLKPPGHKPSTNYGKPL